MEHSARTRRLLAELHADEHGNLSMPFGALALYTAGWVALIALAILTPPQKPANVASAGLALPGSLATNAVEGNVVDLTY